MDGVVLPPSSLLVVGGTAVTMLRLQSVRHWGQQMCSLSHACCADLRAMNNGQSCLIVLRLVALVSQLFVLVAVAVV
jgi:hypothetical protein